MRIKGRIASWHDDKGYGFVEPLAGGKQLFVHIKAFGNRNRRPAVGDVITYALSSDKQGRPCAAKVAFAGEKPKQMAAKKTSTWRIGLALGFLLFIGLGVLTGRLPDLVGITYAAASLITFAAYAMDKSAAKRDGWRVAEAHLHLLALVGGWPGALVAQQLLRHKSKKVSFRVVLWATVLTNVAALIWFMTGDVKWF